MSVESKSFGTSNDQPVELFILTNANGAVAEITNYGGVVTKLIMPDRNGNMADVVLGFDSLDEYKELSPYFGALIGRFGNRIAGGKFSLNGTEYTLVANEMPKRNTHLHGGNIGFDKVIWDAEAYDTDNGPALELSYLSKDGEEGYPGYLSVKTVYTLTNDNALKIHFTATTDQDTVVNLTNHSYFNLAGEGSGEITDHQVKIHSDSFTPVNAELIPTGEIRQVAGTPLDFNEFKTIGRDIDADYDQMEICGGYDHNFVIRNDKAGELALAAEVLEPNSGRVLEVYTTQPGTQFYTGNFLSDEEDLFGKGGKLYPKCSAFCFEPQHFPDSPNKPQFPSAVLKTGDIYDHTIIYKFSTK